jgi:GMP reductase
MANYIKEKFPETFLIVGNVATSEAVEEIESWGADAIKVGIAGGSVCITKNKTGVHRPMVSTVLDCSNVAKVPIVADGGIIEHGDIAKALACGATMVMAGSLFAGYDQSAGNIIEIDDRMYKEYYGSASKYNKNEYKNVEGKKILIQYKGDMSKLLIELKEDLQSSISYVGGTKVEHLNFAEIYKV